ncbi:MAG: hypothetical protein AAF567_05045 [Actinomycetota bacterium]
MTTQRSNKILGVIAVVAMLQGVFLLSGPAAQAQGDDDSYILEDAGLGEGPACEPTVDVDRLPREAVSAATYGTPTVIFDTSFDDPVDYVVLSGGWTQTDGELQQTRDCGYDYTALMPAPQVDHFEFEATLRGLTGVNQGGLLFNQSSETTRSGAMVVDLANGGTVLRWGKYDDAGYYDFLGSAAVTASGTDTISVTVRGAVVDIYFNDAYIASTRTDRIGGYVGLISTLSAVAFESATLTAIPETPTIDPIQPGLTVRSGSHIDSFRVVTLTDTYEIWETPGGAYQHIELADGENIVEMYGRMGALESGSIDQISFVTDTGRTIGPFGMNYDHSTDFAFTAPAGEYITDIAGTAGQIITSIDGVTFE